MAVALGPILAFNRGLCSKLALARTDLKRMALSAEVQTNYMPRVLGSMMLRPGMQFIGLTNPGTQIRFIPFVKNFSTTALCEITPQALRVWVNDVLVTRVSVATVITNGTFAGNIAGWTDASETGASTAYAPSVVDLEGNTVNTLGLTATGNARSISRQTVAVAGGDLNKEHALAINIARGPVTLKIGTADGDDSYVAETVLRSGRHSLAFTPTGDFHIEFSSLLRRTVNVTSVAVEAAGIMIVPIPQNFAPASYKSIHYDQSADVVFIAWGGLPRRIERRGAHSWSFVYDLPEDGPFRAENFTTTTITPSARTGNITLTASEPIFKLTQSGALFRIQSVGQTVESVLSGAAQVTDAVKVTGLQTSRQITITTTGTWVGTLELQSSVANIGAWTTVEDYTTNQTNHTYNDFLDNQIIYYRVIFKAYTSGSADVTLSFPSGGINGVVKITGWTNATTVTGTVLAPLGGLDPSPAWWEGAWSDYRGWPTSVAFYEGRLWWFGSDHIIGSVSDAFDSFDDTIEGDSGPIIRSIGSGPVDNINWGLALQRLVIGLDTSEKSIRASSLDEVLTPSNFNIKDCSTHGSTVAQAVKLDTGGFYIQKSGRRVMQLNWGGFYSAVDYASVDLTSIDPDIGILGGGFVHLAIQRQPDTRIHALLADGSVAVLIFDNAESEQAWVKVVFADGALGIVEDIVVLPGTIEDQVYYVVAFPPDIYSSVRWLVKWAREDECQGATLNKQADAFVAYTGAPTTTLTGGTHLNGHNVVVWADGKVLKNADGTNATFLVAGGSITVPNAVSNAIWGLPYTAQFKSTKLAYAAQLGTALGQRKRVVSVAVIASNLHAQGVKFGPDFNTLDDMPSTEDGAVVDPDSIWDQYDKGAIPFPGGYNPDSRLCMQSQAPRPCTLLGAIIEVETSTDA